MSGRAAAEGIGMAGRARAWPVLLLLAVVGGLTLARIAWLALDAWPLHGDEAQYWVWAKHPALGYFSKPPLVAWLIALTTGAFGDGTLAVRLASPLAHAGAALLVFLVGRRLYGSEVGLWAAIAYATLPAVAVSAGIISTDPPLLLFWALALYAFVRAIEERASPWWWPATGGAIGLAMLAKYTAIAFPLSMLLYLALAPAQRPRLATAGPWVALAVALVVLAPNLLWNAQAGFVSLRHLGENAALGGPLLHPLNLLEFLGSQAGVIGPLLLAAVAALLWRWRDTVRDPRQGLLLAFTLPLLAAISLQALLSQANANWAAPAWIGGTLAAVAWLLGGERRRWLAWSTGVNLALGALVLALALAHAGRPSTLPAWSDPFRKQRGGEELGLAVADALAAHRDAYLLMDARKLIAQTLYYAGVPLARAVAWNPDGVPGDHFELVTRFPEDPEAGFVLATRRAEPADILARFAHSRPLGEVRVPTHADAEDRLHLFRLEGFLGYGDAEAP
jgi:4-amino-4-deoxy-L-arabinose transferase-like glycosyltransferase